MELNFEGMKRILTTPQETTKQAEVDKEKRELMMKRLKEEDFDDLMQFTEFSVSQLNFDSNFYSLINFAARSSSEQAG